MIDKAIEELFEANISGKITDERFVKMTDNYEKEQKDLLELVADGNEKLQAAEQSKVDLKLLMKALRDYTDIRQLTPEIVNALIRRIEVHSKDKKTKKVKVGIYFTAVGCSLRRRNRSCRRQWRKYAKTRSSSEFLHKAEHGAAPVLGATPYPT